MKIENHWYREKGAMVLKMANTNYASFNNEATSWQIIIVKFVKGWPAQTGHLPNTNNIDIPMLKDTIKPIYECG